MGPIGGITVHAQILSSHRLLQDNNKDLSAAHKDEEIMINRQLETLHERYFKSLNV
jgi:hypothetical protein